MTSRLCVNCSNLPLDAGLKTLQGDYRGSLSWPFGRYGDIRRRNCPFCKLIASICAKHLSSWHPLTPPDDDHQVTVQYHGSRGFTTAYSRLGSYVLPVLASADQEAYGARAPLDEWIDFEMVKSWIAKCNEYHQADGKKCLPARFEPAKLPGHMRRRNYRLIDVHSMRIVYALPGCPYVALSYLWGRVSRTRLTLTTANEYALLRPGSLGVRASEIPNTILDSMSVVRKLGERYLWVDSLCLLQDDVEELTECVSIMDLFYEMATFTIIAACGKDAFSGIPGVPPTQRAVVRPTQIIKPGLTMTTIADVDTLLQNSIYNSRAWTIMQEEILSYRQLIFVGDQVFWKCGQSHYSEVLNMRGRQLKDLYSSVGSLKYAILQEDDSANFREYSSILSYYMARQLTFDSDVFRAVQGMLRKFSLLSGLQCFEGLPPPFEQSLLFTRGDEPMSRAFGRRKGFASYSWTGWMSTPYYQGSLDNTVEVKNDKAMEDHNEELVTPNLRGWIIWHFKHPDGRTYRIDAKGKPHKSPPPTPEAARRNSRRQFQQVREFVSDADFSTVRAKSHPLLLFWTICINLGMKPVGKVKGRGFGPPGYAATRVDGSPCGSVSVDMAMPGVTVGQFAILAAATDGFWALLVKWEEDGIAERRGVVKLSKDVLETCLPPGPRWKSIILG